jgi:hypothetical protein
VDELARLRQSITRHAGDGLTPTALPGISVVCSPTTSEPLCGIAEPTLAVVAQGVKATTLNGRTFTYGPGQFLVVSVDLPVVGHITHARADEPFLAFVLELRPQMIAALLLETATLATAGPAVTDASPAGIAVSDASPALLDVIARLVALLDAPDDAAALSAGVEREVLWRLITGPQGSTVRQIGLADSRLAHLARAIRWIRGHYNETLRVEELAALAAMSVSSFHRHFRAVTSMTQSSSRKRFACTRRGHDSSPSPGTSPASASPSATTAPPSSAASTAACSACHRAATRERSATGLWWACQRPRNRSVAASVTGVNRLTRFPSGSRNKIERLPHGIVVGSWIHSLTIGAKRAYSASTSSTRNSMMTLWLSAACAEPAPKSCTV